MGAWKGGQSPRAALCVPEDAETDPAVKSLGARLFSDMIVFILLHEIGHVVNGDAESSDGGLAAERAEESAADAFAVRQMATIGEAPLAMPVFFMFTANLAKGPQDFIRKKNTPPMRKTSAIRWTPRGCGRLRTGLPKTLRLSPQRTPRESLPSPTPRLTSGSSPRRSPTAAQAASPAGLAGRRPRRTLRR